MVLALVTLAVVIILILMWRHQKTKERGLSAPTKVALPLTSAHGEHHAVYVKYDKKNCCAAVRELSLKKFLSAEAPALPLTDCDRPRQCHCVYRHLEDRRSKGGRRATDHGFGEVVYYGPERRSGKERRDEADNESPVEQQEEPRDYFTG